MDGFPPHIAEAVRASEARIVITGSSGWIGKATLDLLASALGEDFATRITCFGSSRRTFQLPSGISIEQRPLAEISSLETAPTIVLHLAFLTKDRAEVMEEMAYCAANRAIGQTVLDALDSIGAVAIFIASSGAARFADDPQATPAMRLYGSLKREHEEIFATWAEQQRKTAVIARIFNISGPHINKQDSYALAMFINDGLAGRPIAIRSAHRVIRSYVAVGELMSLAFALLLGGQGRVIRFDSGGEAMEMQDIAAVVASQLGALAILRPPLDARITDRYVGDDGLYRALLAEHCIDSVSFERQVSETIDFLSLAGTRSPSDRVAI